MSRQFPYINFLFFLLLLQVSSPAQTTVSVKAAINRNEILIGEPIELKLEARLSGDTTASWFPLDSLHHFEIIDKGKIDTVRRGENVTYRQTLLITSFDSGRWDVPSLPFTIGNREYLSDSLPVTVAYVNFDSARDYHDIKDILESDYTSTRYVNPILVALSVLALAAIIYLLRKKTESPVIVPVKKSTPRLAPLQEALAGMLELEKHDLANPASVKYFHAALNDILRNYIFRKTGMATLEKTSGELMIQLKQFNLPAADFSSLAQVLRMNDAVKFAKYLPAAEDNRQALQTVRNSLEQLEYIIDKSSQPTNIGS